MTSHRDVELCSLAEHPDLLSQWDQVHGGWPIFMEQDPVALRRYQRAWEVYPQLHLLGLLGDEPVARVHAVPIHWDGPDRLPPTGWDWALGEAIDNPPTRLTAVSLLEIRIDPSHRGHGLSHQVVAEVRGHLQELGVEHLVGPVRPNGKAAMPDLATTDYLARVRSDGLPEDGWLRVHVRAGGRIVGIAPMSMVIPGTLDQWRAWTGLAFDRSGLFHVPGALAPVHVNVAEDHAVYVEPNVWVHHDLGH